MTPEEEAVLRDLAEMNVEYIGDEWAVACLKVFGLLDAERAKTQAAVKWIQCERAKVAALEAVAEAARTSMKGMWMRHDPIIEALAALDAATKGITDADVERVIP